MKTKVLKTVWSIEGLPKKIVDFIAEKVKCINV